MALAPELLHRLTTADAKAAWTEIITHITSIAAKPLAADTAVGEVSKRDREIGALDNFLATAGWDLWHEFAASVERTSEALIKWWAQPFNAKAILILDGLSLRELPWLVQGAQQRGLTIHGFSATASEIPGETNQFAQAMGFNSRSQLQNNGGGTSHSLQPAHTECVDLPWLDCAGLINGNPNWILWHHWPDSKVHEGSGAGQGLDALTKDAADQLMSDGFWTLVERLATGRRLMITSDHGYAATGYFPDADGEVRNYLKQTFSSGRSVAGKVDTGPFVPPVAMQLHGSHGDHTLALGRWKWKSQGGYPTLAHGGLSLLEVLSPMVEISKTGTH